MPETKAWSKVYQQRDSLIRDIGHQNYATYLESITWGKIRGRVMDRDKNKCRICGGKATAVHHLQYDRKTLLGQTLIHMIGICHWCHEGLEFKDGQKLPGEEVQKRYKDKAFRRSLRNQQRQNRSDWWKAQQPEPVSELDDEFREIVFSTPRERVMMTRQRRSAVDEMTVKMEDGYIELKCPIRLKKADLDTFCKLLDTLRGMLELQVISDDEPEPSSSQLFSPFSSSEPSTAPLSNYRSKANKQAGTITPLQPAPATR